MDASAKWPWMNGHAESRCPPIGWWLYFCALAMKAGFVAQPILQAIVLADHIYVDAHTGKKILAGTFNSMTVQSEERQFDRTTFAYLNLTELDGPKSIQLKFVDLKTNEVLMRGPILRTETKSQLNNVEIILEVPPFPIPHAGTYALEAHCDGEILGWLRITAHILNESEEENEHG